MSHCILAVSSITYAMKGEGLLLAAGIRAKTVRLEPHRTRRGCGYGLSLPRFDCRTASAILHRNGIPYSQVLWD